MSTATVLRYQPDLESAVSSVPRSNAGEMIQAKVKASPAEAAATRERSTSKAEDEAVLWIAHPVANEKRKGARALRSHRVHAETVKSTA